jgi:hypothetical protein
LKWFSTSCGEASKDKFLNYTSISSDWFCSIVSVLGKYLRLYISSSSSTVWLSTRCYLKSSFGIETFYPSFITATVLSSYFSSTFSSTFSSSLTSTYSSTYSSTYFSTYSSPSASGCGTGTNP